MSTVTIKHRAPKTIPVAISSGQTASDAINISDVEFLGIETSTAFSGTALTFQVARSSGGSFVDLYSGNTQLSVTVSTAASRAYVVETTQSSFAPWAWMKVVSNSTGEAAARTLYLHAK